MVEQLANFGETTLAEALDASETAITVADGSVFPASGNFRVVVDNEIMLVSARTTNDLTVTRGAESTTAAVHDNGSDIKMVLTAAGLTTAITESAFIGCRAYHNTTQSSGTAGAVTDVTFNTDSFDPYSLHDAAGDSTKFIADRTGKWRCTCYIYWATPTGNYALSFEKNDDGVDLSPQQYNLLTMLGTNVFELSATDYIKARVYHDTGTPNIGHASAGVAQNFFIFEYLGT